jgi:hypothetical protein
MYRNPLRGRGSGGGPRGAAPPVASAPPAQPPLVARPPAALSSRPSPRNLLPGSLRDDGDATSYDAASVGGPGGVGGSARAAAAPALVVVAAAGGSRRVSPHPPGHPPVRTSPASRAAAGPAGDGGGAAAARRATAAAAAAQAAAMEMSGTPVFVASPLRAGPADASAASSPARSGSRPLPRLRSGAALTAARGPQAAPPPAAPLEAGDTLSFVDSPLARRAGSA